MSNDAFQAFLKRIQQDTGLQKELRDRFGDPSAGIPVRELAEFAAGKGYRFTVEDLSGRLSDRQLDAVSGGAFGGYEKIFPKVEGVGMEQRIHLGFSPLMGKI